MGKSQSSFFIKEWNLDKYVNKKDNADNYPEELGHRVRRNKTGRIKRRMTLPEQIEDDLMRQALA